MSRNINSPNSGPLGVLISCFRPCQAISGSPEKCTRRPGAENRVIVVVVVA